MLRWPWWKRVDLWLAFLLVCVALEQRYHGVDTVPRWVDVPYRLCFFWLIYCTSQAALRAVPWPWQQSELACAATAIAWQYLDWVCTLNIAWAGLFLFHEPAEPPERWLVAIGFAWTPWLLWVFYRAGNAVLPALCALQWRWLAPACATAAVAALVPGGPAAWVCHAVIWHRAYKAWSAGVPAPASEPRSSAAQPEVPPQPVGEDQARSFPDPALVAAAKREAVRANLRRGLGHLTEGGGVNVLDVRVLKPARSADVAQPPLAPALSTDLT